MTTGRINQVTVRYVKGDFRLYVIVSYDSAEDRKTQASVLMVEKENCSDEGAIVIGQTSNP